MNPATPATILALAATILLALATCTVPVTKSLYFLDVNLSNRDIKFGALGYCLGSRCTSPSVGYRIDDASTLLGISGSIPYASQLSSGVVHALTYTLILHPVACGLAAISVLFGLLNHCAGFGIGCVGGFFTGFAITVSLVAFGLDLGLFTILKKRVESAGGTAQYGNGIWMTLAAFVCLVLCQIAFCCCCCGSRGGSSRRNRRSRDKDKDDFHTPHPDTSYGDRMRMDALEAEVNRNNHHSNTRQQDLPKFAEYVTEHEVPLKHDYDERYGNAPAHNNHRQQQQQYHSQAPQQHYAMGQAYGGGPNGYADPYGSADPYDAGGTAAPMTGYVAGVGPTYGNGSGARDLGGGYGDQRDAYDHNNVGGFGAHGYPASTAENSYYPDQGQYHDGSAPSQAVGGVVGRQPSTYHYGEGAHRSRRTSEASGSASHSYGRETMPVPEPMPALPLEYANESAAGNNHRSATRTQDDGFGLAALQAYDGRGGDSKHAAAGEPSGMYYDAEELDNDEREFGQLRSAHGDVESGTHAPWQHSSSARGQGDAYSLTDMHAVGGGRASSQHHGGTGDVPSYEVATGQAGQHHYDESSAAAATSPTSPSAMRAAGSYRPLPVPGNGHAQEWPDEKRR